MHKIYDYRSRREALLREAEADAKNRTPEQIEKDQLKTEESLKEILDYINLRSRMFRKVPSQKKRHMFFCAVKMLREFADLHDGLLEVEVEKHVGKILLTLDCIQHTIDSIDSSRFFLGFLFLHYEGISIFPVEQALQLQIVESLYDEVPNSPC